MQEVVTQEQPVSQPQEPQSFPRQKEEAEQAVRNEDEKSFAGTREPTPSKGVAPEKPVKPAEREQPSTREIETKPMQAAPDQRVERDESPDQKTKPQPETEFSRKRLIEKELQKKHPARQKEAEPEKEPEPPFDISKVDKALAESQEKEAGREMSGQEGISEKSKVMGEEETISWEEPSGTRKLKEDP
ncbi:MAG: hypothetical protein ACOC7U_03240, partial [Spirochaetota bacterium]